MVRKSVRHVLQSPRAPDRLWSGLGGFAQNWHPMVTRMEQEPAGGGRVIRAFETGDGGLYREELTYLSDSDHTYAYRMLSGIEGADSYEARLKISAVQGGSALSWQAEFTAEATRAEEIASGTQAIFEAGLAEIDRRTGQGPAAPRVGQPVALAQAQIGETPRRALSFAPAHLTACDTLCLFLHGIGGQRSNWDAQLAALGGEYPVMAMDLRGYGDSTLGFGPSTIDDYCDDILDVMAHVSAKRVVLIGLSYGSWIATSFAMRHADKLAGLVLCGGCTGMSEADPDEREAFRVSREVPLDAGQTPADFAPAVVDIIAGPEATDEARAILRASMAAISAETYRDALGCFCNPLEQFDFGRLACPVLLMTGEHDVLAPPAEIRAISHRIHEAATRPATAGPVRFEVIAGAGHVCNIEAPEQVNRHLAAFLTTLGLSRPTPANSRKAAARAEKHDRILRAALREFAQNGYAGASMGAIAQEAGVSKPTLYQYIGQKEDMFAAILDAGRKTLLFPFEGQAEAPMVDTLWRFAGTYAGFVLSADILALARVVIGEAGRAPELARRYHDNGPGRAFNGIKRYLDTQRDLGRLSYDDTAQAAEHLWALILSAPRTRALHFPDEPISDKTLEASVRGGLATFLRAYATRPDDDLAALGTQIWERSDA